MNQVQQAILALLNVQAVGSANAMNSDSIFQALTAQNLPVFQGRTQEQVRAEIRSMINDHNQLIGSNSGFGPNNGYYIITNKDEVVDTIMDLVGRSRRMLERVEALRQTWNNQNPGNTI